MSIKEKIDDTLIEIDTRFQRARNDIGKLENIAPSERVNFQNDIKKQIDTIHAKIIEVKVGSQKLSQQFSDFYKTEVKNLFSQHRQLLLDFKKIESLPIKEEPHINPLSPNEQKAEKVTKQLDEIIQNQVEMVTRKLDKEIKKAENKLQRVKNDLERLDQCLPSQRINFQNEIQKQLDVIQLDISKINNSSRSLPPELISSYNDKTNILISRQQQYLSDLKNKETPVNIDLPSKPVSNVVIERSVNIESINDINEPNEEIKEKKCFNPCMKNYIIWPIVALLLIGLGFSLFWKLR